MGSARLRQLESEPVQISDRTLRGCQLASEAAALAGRGLAGGSANFLPEVRRREEALDQLDLEINEAVTLAVPNCSGSQCAELLACLKLIIELERVGDLLLSFANRAATVTDRLAAPDVRDLSTMLKLLQRMLAEATEAFRQRNTDIAMGVLRADAELDRLRNLIFVRHLENPDNQRQQESFHVVFMTQALERAGDHAKNMSEEVIHLVAGRSVRHLLRAQDKPDEVRFLEVMRRRGGNAGSAAGSLRHKPRT